MPPDDPIIPDPRTVKAPQRWTPTTFRSWAWEWGTLVCIAAIPLVVASWFTPPPWALLSVPITIPAGVLGLYSARLAQKYPTRGDLPEFKEWKARQERTILL